MPSKGKGKAKSKDDDKEFNQLMQQLQQVSGESHKKKKNEKKIITTEERKALHRDRTDTAKKAKEVEFARTMENAQRQQRVRQMIEMMMKQQRPFLDAPNTTITTEFKDGQHFAAGVAEMQGWRTNMEDAHALLPNFGDRTGFFAVFDGHAGAQAAELASKVLPAVVSKHLCPRWEEPLLVDIFTQVDDTLRQKLQDQSATMGPGGTAGTTAVAVIVNDTQIVCASVGDSRAVLCRGGSTVPLAFDHKPEDEGEKERILAANGTVDNNRVNGALAMSRALGDFGYKANKQLSPAEQQVSCVPRVVTKDRVDEDEFLVLACDGIYDVMTNEDVVAFVREKLSALAGEPTTNDLVDIASSMTRACLAPGGDEGPVRGEGTDNMTAMIVTFKK